MMWRLVLSLATLVMVPTAVVAQPSFDFYDRGPYRVEVPQPDALLGYTAGTTHTLYHRQQAVFDRFIKAAPDRVRAVVIGKTEEGRPMRLLLISSPANLRRLDGVRDDLARLADPRVTSPEQAESIVNRSPVVAFLNYSVHGNEPAGFEASMWVAYQLLASEEPATTQILDSVLVVVNPSANPDGHERFAVWYNSIAHGSDDPFAFEAREPWSIAGRYSHFRFDMNRDLVAVSQAPVKAMLGAMRRWHPQVVVDFHSTTDPYFFPPFADPVNRNIPPSEHEWIEIFGRANAAAFDRYGWQYYTRDRFDGYYPGYFDVAPTLAGASGMTYESDGGPELRIRRADGTIITFADGIAHHYVASMATLEAAASHRKARLTGYYNFHRTAIEEARGSPMRRFIVEPDRDATNAARLVDILRSHDIEVTRIDSPYSARVVDFMGGRQQKVERVFKAGAYVVDLTQPQARMARALLEPTPALPADFAKRQIDRFRENVRRGSGSRRGYDFYDVTGWSLPYTLGLDAYWTDDLSPIVGPSLNRSNVAPVTGVTPRVQRAQSAYVFGSDRQSATVLALALMREGFTVNAADEDLRADGQRYARGAFVVRTQRNPATLHNRISTLADSLDVPVAAVASAFADSGQVGVGSGAVRHIKTPRILVAAGSEISNTSYGALWHFLESELGQPFVPVSLSRIGSMNTMSDYNVLIIPDGSAARIETALGKRGIERLKAWVKDGGVVIAWGGSALLFSRDAVGLGSVRSKGTASDDDSKRDSLEQSPTLVPPLPSPSADTDKPAYIPGSIFKATLDSGHWLTLGYARSSLAVMMSGSTMLQPSRTGANPVAFVEPSLLLSGFAWPDNTERLLKGTVWAAVETHGRGHVVVFASDPLFRGFWRGTGKLMTNAMLFGTGR
ncbi:MAG: hypothetical protein HKN37_16020 [Rhodothermales bacterium]|nr:hypothetical protein [Rhodothermales bacterium]